LKVKKEQRNTGKKKGRGQKKKKKKIKIRTDCQVNTKVALELGYDLVYNK